MKKCPKCNIYKDREYFALNNSRSDGLQPYCRECKAKTDKNNYNKNKNTIQERNTRNRKIVREWFREFRKTCQCAICGENHPGCLDFHHRGTNNKRMEVSVFVFRTTSIDALISEINKCVVLCANCHRKLHYNERNAQ